MRWSGQSERSESIEDAEEDADEKLRPVPGRAESAVLGREPVRDVRATGNATGIRGTEGTAGASAVAIGALMPSTAVLRLSALEITVAGPTTDRERFRLSLGIATIV